MSLAPISNARSKSRVLPRWLGALGIIGGAATAVAGFVMAYAGFSATAMMVSMPSTSLLLVWMIVLGIYGWRRIF